MALWRILAYHTGDFACPIQDWYALQNEEVQAAFDATLIILRATVDWPDTKAFKGLTKKHRGLGEIRFRLDGPPIRRFRPVGIWPPLVAREFVMLLGCEKRMGAYTPKNAFDLALEYKRQFEAGIGGTIEYI